MLMTPSKFWELTFAEFWGMMKGFKRAQRKEENNLIAAAWMTAKLCRATDIPELDSLLLDENDDPQPAKEQTVDQMINIVRAINAAHGGIEVKT